MGSYQEIPDRIGEIGGVWAVVPVKALSEAKGRLMPYLNHQERGELMVRMLQRVFAALAGARTLEGWLVVGRDGKVFDIARQWGGKSLWEERQGLNDALAQASRWLASRRANGLLIVPGDLPLIRTEDIERIVATGKDDRCLVIAPSQRDGGTNALLLKPPQVIPFRFGEGSFRAHISEARRSGVPVQIYNSPSLALDIDTIEDLRQWEEISVTLSGSRTTDENR